MRKVGTESWIECQTCAHRFTHCDFVQCPFSLVGYEKYKATTSCVYCKKGEFVIELKEVERKEFKS